MDTILDGTDPDADAEGLISISRDDAPVDAPKLWGEVVILEPDANTDKWGNDDYRLNGATIADSTLTVSVSYGGGCRKHQFTLIIAMNSGKMSDPVQHGVSIVHNANEDPCEAYPTETYHFDLVPIKTKYQITHQRKAGRIVLNLEGAPEDTPELIYEFTE